WRLTGRGCRARYRWWPRSIATTSPSAARGRWSARRRCRSRIRMRRSTGVGAEMSGDSDDYVYDEATGEWRPASEVAAAAAEAATVVGRAAAGNVRAEGDSVTLIKDLKVKGTSQTLKQGTVTRSIRLTDNPEAIDCRHDTIKGLVL